MEKESSQSINFLMPPEPTFSREDSKWVASSCGLTTNDTPTLVPYPIFRIEWPTQFHEALPTSS